MKLYYSPGACSLAPHIVLREAGIPVTLDKVNIPEKKTESGGDFFKINDKGYVPALTLDGGETLTEGPAIMQYIADQKPATGLAPAAGSMDRVRLQEWLNFITSELHKGLGALFNPTMPDSYKPIAKENVSKRLDYINKHMTGRNFVMGEKFSVADAYLFTVFNWCNFLGIDQGRWPALQAFAKRVSERPAVQAALKAEGLVK